MQDPASPLELELSGKVIVVAYGKDPTDAVDDGRDIMTDINTISQSLRTLGYEPVPLAVSLDFEKLLDELRRLKPLMVFNLVDTIYDHDALLHWPPSLLDTYHIPYTGVGAKAQFCTTDKLLAKQIMMLSGIPTPQWQPCERLLEESPQVLMPCIVKPVRNDSSEGMDESSVCATPDALVAKVSSIQPADRPWFFAEQFIEGREFNISLLATQEGVRVLPPAEMTFVDYPNGKPTIVDYRAKWVEGSFEYTHTVRRFEYPDSDQPLLDDLKGIALRCWSLFGLDGYARVDFRVDKTGKPWVLEINANPCISPDAGFVAAAARAGYTYDQVIGAIVDDVLRRLRKAGRPAVRRRQRRRALSRKR